MNALKTWTAQERAMLFRKAHDKLGRARYLERLAAFFATPVQPENLLGLAETDALHSRELTRRQEKHWISSQKPNVLLRYREHQYLPAEQILAQAQTLLEHQPCAVYWQDDGVASHECGAYRAAVGTRIRPDYDFSIHRPDDIWFYAADGSSVLHLEYFEDSRLAVWLLACSQACLTR